MESNSDFTGYGGGKTVLPDPVRRRSARIASLDDSLEKDESHNNVGELATPAPKQKQKLNLILHNTSSEIPSTGKNADTETKGQSSSNRSYKKTTDTKVKGDQSSSKRSHKKRNTDTNTDTDAKLVQSSSKQSHEKKNADTEAKKDEVSTKPSHKKKNADTDDKVDQPSNKRSHKKKEVPQDLSLVPVGSDLGVKPRSIAGRSSAVAGSLSSQQSSAMELDNPQQEGGVPALSNDNMPQGRFAIREGPGAPTYVFDTNSPYSVFSINPAAPQQPPSAAPHHSALPNELPSSPSNEALTNAIHNSIQKKGTEAQNKVDHNDPSWRHPWGIPVDPAPKSCVPKGFNQPAGEGAAPAFDATALILLQDRAEMLQEQGANEEDVRRSTLAASIMGSLMTERAKAEQAKAKGKAPANPQAQQNQPPRAEFNHLALSKVKLASVNAFGYEPSGSGSSQAKGKGKEVDRGVGNACTFCKFACDWGISDDRILLPEEVSTGTCYDCGEANSAFFSEWTTIMETRDDEPSRDYLETAQHEVAQQAERAVPQGNRVYSKIDGAEITKFMGPMFCKSCPWGQVDIMQVTICSVHRNEKFAIIKHHRHQEFRPIAHALPGDLYSADTIRNMDMNVAEDAVRGDTARHEQLTVNFKEHRRCMMCTGLAMDICVGCPLRLCSSCSVLLKNICKGYLDNLFYHYERHHLRNDAFLLRSDGGGF